MGDYKNYCSWKGICKKTISAIPKTIAGAYIFVSLMKKDKKTHYVFCPGALGDSILALSYLSEFKRQRGIPHVTIVCTPYVKRLCSYYPNAVDSVICLTPWQTWAVREFVETRIGEYYSMLNLDRCTFVFFNCVVSVRTIWNNHNIDYQMFAKALIYKISMESRPEWPKIPEQDIGEIVERYGLMKGRTVFINPVANSVRCDASELLAEAASALKEKGYRVVTLTAKSADAPVNGTQAIPCGLETAFSLIKFGGILIGVRSGFMDLMVYTDSKIITVNDEGHGFTPFYSLENLGVNSDCHSVMYDGNVQTALRQIVEAVEQNERAGES